MKKSDLNNPIKIQWVKNYLARWFMLSFPGTNNLSVETFEIDPNLKDTIKSFGLLHSQGYMEISDLCFITSFYKRYFVHNYEKIMSNYQKSDKPYYFVTTVEMVESFEKYYGLVEK